jgi:hypothetical protein
MKRRYRRAHLVLDQDGLPWGARQEKLPGNASGRAGFFGNVLALDYRCDHLARDSVKIRRFQVAFAVGFLRQAVDPRDFILKDPDGNLLLFAGPAE